MLSLFLIILDIAFLQPVASEVGPVSAVKTLVLCDYFDAVLKCPPNTVIAVQSAFHGRTSDKYCATGPRHDYNCNSGPRALRIAAAKCNNRQSCFIWNALFGDPCFGTYKYLELSYTCKALQTAVACEDETLSIRCPAGKYISIREAFYGRTSDEYCDRGPRTDYTCSLSTFKIIASNTCNNKETCFFHNVGRMYPDPCVGTFKYMNVAYECLDHQLSVACEGKSNYISCPPGKLIKVITGFSGRTSDEFCVDGPRLTYECSAPGAHQAAVNMCHNKQVCIFAGLPVPDPCPYTLKYTTVSYRCG